LRHNPYKLVFRVCFMRVQHVPKIIEREEENCYLLINRKNGKKLVLSEISFFVWKLCEDSTVEDIIETAVERFDVDRKTAEKQITKLIESLHQKGFIQKENQKEVE